MGACSLDHFSEGYVGKLRVRKSGKAELVLGDIVLDVTMGTSCGFLQVRPCFARTSKHLERSILFVFFSAKYSHSKIGKHCHL